MSHVPVSGRRNDSAIEVPSRIGKAGRQVDSEDVAVETVNGDFVKTSVICSAEKRADARMAVKEIIAASKGYTLGGLSIRELRDEGRP